MLGIGEADELEIEIGSIASGSDGVKVSSIRLRNDAGIEVDVGRIEMSIESSEDFQYGISTLKADRIDFHDWQSTQRTTLTSVSNESLAVGYYLKEDLRQLWAQPDYHRASRVLTSWCARARPSGIRVLQTMANTLQRHRTGILSWYTWTIPTGQLEGTNSKIKTLNKQAYGFIDIEYFKLKIKAIHLIG